MISICYLAFPDRLLDEGIYSYLPGRENGPADAYRHILLGALLANAYGEEVVREITQAYEVLECYKLAATSKQNGQPAKDFQYSMTVNQTAMDLHNNEGGG